MVPIEQEAGWSPEPVRTFWIREKSFPCQDSNPDRPAVARFLMNLCILGLNRSACDDG